MLLAAVAGVGCGSKLAPLDAPPLESSPWLLTFESGTEGPSRAGVLRAHRFHDGKAHHEMLDPSGLMPPSWSPSRHWMAYGTALPEGGEGLRLRRFDGERWYEPVAVTIPGADDADVISDGWSPTRDQLLVRSRRPTSTEIAIAMPRADGSIASTLLVSQEFASARWAASGDRVVVVRRDSSGRRVSVVDVSNDAELITTSHDVVPPPGTTFDDLEPDRDESGIADGTISSDGRWIVFVVKKGEDDATKALYAFSTKGESPPHVLEGCPVSRSSGAVELCRPYSWTPGGSTLLVRRGRTGARMTLEAWTPATDTLVSLGNLEPSTGWAGPRGSLFVASDGASRRHSIIDLRDTSSPVITAVPTTELSSFRMATASYDGRWLLLRHTDERANIGWYTAIDLHGGAPWQPREIYRGSEEMTSRGFIWSPGGSFILLRHEQGPPKELERGTRIDLETGAESTIEVTLPPNLPGAVPFFWQWDERMAYDDRTLAIERDGTLALWRMDTPKAAAAKLDGIPATATVWWLPVQ
jgi:hypothetical protein